MIFTKKIYVFNVKKFTEKPDLKTAKRFLKHGNYFWNSGIFIWTCKDILNALESEAPELYEGLKKIQKYLGTLQKREIMKEVFNGLDKISIDYAVLERVNNRLMIKGDFIWDDIGSWTAMERIFPKDQYGNVIQGEHESLDTEGCIIINDEGVIVTIGLSDLVIVSSGDVKLIYPKNRENDLKKIIKRLSNHEDFKRYV